MEISKQPFTNKKLVRNVMAKQDALVYDLAIARARAYALARTAVDDGIDMNNPQTWPLDLNHVPVGELLAHRDFINAHAGQHCVDFAAIAAADTDPIDLVDTPPDMSLIP
jgi:hypothetical protein